MNFDADLNCVTLTGVVRSVEPLHRVGTAERAPAVVRLVLTVRAIGPDGISEMAVSVAALGRVATTLDAATVKPGVELAVEGRLEQRRGALQILAHRIRVY